MSKTTLFSSCIALACIAVAAGTADAKPTGLGVGGQYFLDGVGGASVTYDADKFRIDGILGFSDFGDNDTVVSIGGRALFPVHSAAMSDFSIGGGLGLQSQDVGADENFTIIVIEAIGQARVFLTSNFALTFSLGFNVETSDGDQILVTSDTTGGAGFTYMFY